MSVASFAFYTVDLNRITDWAEETRRSNPEVKWWDLALGNAPGVVVCGQPALTPVYFVYLGFTTPQDLLGFMDREDWRADYERCCA